MQPNPFSALLHSRKFWLAILDLVISLSTYFITKYATPVTAEDAIKIIAAIQPVFITIIGAVAYEDGKNIVAENSYEQGWYAGQEAAGDKLPE